MKIQHRIEDEISQIKSEINRLNYRVSLLEKQVAQNKEVGVSEVYRDMHSENPFKTINKEIDTVVQPEIRQTFSKNNIEDNIGKNLMSIIASLMVFAGICGFVALVIQNSSNIVKILAMFIFSFIFYGIGLVLLKKKKDVLSLSLTSCGIGAVYISLLVTHFYFNMLGEITLGVLLLGWSVLAFVLARRIKSDLFCSISYIGYSIAIVLGTLSTLYSDRSLYAHIMALVLSVCFSIFTLKIMRDDNVCSHKLHYVIYLISLVVCWLLTQLIGNTHEEKVLVSNIIDIAASFIIVELIVHQIKLFIKNSKSEIVTLCMIVLASIVQLITVMVGVQDTIIEWFIPLAILGIYSQYTGIEEKLQKSYKIVYLSFCILSCILASEYLFALLIIMPFVRIAIGVKEQNNFELTLANVCIALATIAILDEYDAAIILVIITVAMWVSLIWALTKRYSLLNKILLYFNVIFGSWTYICAIIGNICELAESRLIVRWLNALEYDLILPYIWICIILIFTGLSAFATDWSNGRSFIKKDEFSKYDALFGINHVLQYIWLGWGMFVIEFTEPGGVLQFILVLISLMLCVSDLHYVMEIKSDWKAIASEIKSTLFTCYSLSLYLPPDTGYILSIFCIILAILSICSGFKFKVKGFRLYGLGLSMISVFKLLLIDIYIDEPLVRVGSFILAGILCFIIVFIYNRLSKDDSHEG